MKPKRAYHVIFGISLLGLVALGGWWSIFFKRSIDFERAAAMKDLRAATAMAAFRLGHRGEPPAPGPVPGDIALEVVAVASEGDKGPIFMQLAPRYPELGVRPPPSTIAALDERERRRWAMVVGEGGLLFVLLAVCSFMLYRLVRQERRYINRMEDFLSAITHEMKTPVAGIKSLLQTFASGKVPDGQEVALSAMGLKEVERLDHLIENVLISGRLRADVFDVRLEQVPVRDLLDGFVEHRRRYLPDRPEAIQLVWEAEAEALLAQADSSALRVVLENLTDNAFKYGGDKPEVTLRVGRAAASVSIAVEDKGRGFEPGRAEDLFRPFRRVLSGETTAQHGTGLGLSLARTLARRMGGEIEAHSSGLDQGSRFVVTLKEASS